MKRILVPLDGSKRSEEVLKLVQALSQKNGIDLTLLEVFNNSPISYTTAYGTGFGADPLVTFQKQEGRGGKIVETILREGEIKVDQCRALVAEGNPADRICEIANREQIDLIVMASNGYVGVERLLLGSVTEKVIRNAPCPVLAVKEDLIPTHFLIALDKTPLSERILKPAVTLADLLDADITLTHIRKLDSLPTADDLRDLHILDPELYEVIMIATEYGADFYLDKIMEMVQANLDVNIDYTIEYGKPNQKIVEVGLERDCDLIAMNTHGRSGLDRLRKGSTTEWVFEHTSLPMLITHHENPNPQLP